MLAQKALQNILVLTWIRVFCFIPFLPSHYEKDERAKASHLPDKYFLSQDSIFLASRAGNLPGMVQFEDRDCSHSARKYGLSKVLHMSQHTDIELPLPKRRAVI